VTGNDNDVHSGELLSVFLPSLVLEENFGDVAQIFTGQMTFLSPKQQCQSTEGNSE